MQPITTSAELATLCASLATADYITVDTEFMREKTFWPQLCLIQVASENEEAIIDPLAELDLQPFFDLLTNPSILKVVHSGRQDLEIFYHLGRVIPTPLFDTQVAAMVCGFGESVSYANLVQRYCKQTIDKSSQFTDWRRRPLKEKQLHYAIGDVTFLRDIYKALQRQLTRTDREAWLDEEMSILCSAETYEQHPKDAWKRLKMRARSQRALAIMMEVAEWRERTAQSSDIPRNRVLKDDAIYEIANQAPKDQSALGELRAVPTGFARSRKGSEIVDAVRRGAERDMADVPKPTRRQPVPPEAQAIIELLRVLLKAVSAAEGVASKLIANADDLETIATKSEPRVPAMSGWRRELFGDKALSLKQGRSALRLSDGKVTLIAVSSDQA